MAVLPWSHSKNRNQSGGSSKHQGTWEWLARTTTEPSRQALNDLMKEHSRSVSGSSNSFGGRSRPSTNASHRSDHSHRSQHSSHCTAFTPEISGALQSRPVSPARSVSSVVDKSETPSAARTLLSKAGLLRRKGSKMGLISDTASTNSVISPPRVTPSRNGFRKRDSPVSPVKYDSPRPVISDPFDFHHVTHTEQDHFLSLSRIDESELASQFSHLQAQQTGAELRGISTTNIKSSPPLSQTAAKQQESLSSHGLPSTPPRPAPPPKNSPKRLVAPTEVRISRSMENFSRPTPRSPTASTVNPTLSSRPSQASLTTATSVTDVSIYEDACFGPALTKPLPQLPTVIHAVSTLDDTARMLMSVPLPPPPPSGTSAESHGQRQQHKRQSSSRGSLRHMSTFPSPRYPKPQINAVNDKQLLGIQEESESIPRHRSNHELSKISRFSGHHSALSSDETDPRNTWASTNDWDKAIDYAWDEASISEDFPGEGESRRLRHTSQHELVVHQPQYEPNSSPSTPLMTMAPSKLSRVGNYEEAPSDSAAKAGLHSAYEVSPAVLKGLGIDTSERVSPPRTSRPPTLEVTLPPSSDSYTSPRALKSTYSALSKSSSQESIILSVASSIMGTQRSSHSSISFSEFAPYLRDTDLPTPVSSCHSPLANHEAQRPTQFDATHLTASLGSDLEFSKPARPESTCIPLGLLKGFDSTTVDPVEPAKPEVGQKLSESAEATTLADAELEQDAVPELPKQTRPISASRMHVPRRSSSIVTTDTAKSPRPRANTTGARSRSTRTSYSLFPQATPEAIITS